MNSRKDYIRYPPAYGEISYLNRHVLPGFHTYYPNIEERRIKSYAQYSHTYWENVSKRAIEYRKNKSNCAQMTYNIDDSLNTQ